MRTKVPVTCYKCQAEVLQNQGMRIIQIDTEEDLFFCRSCLKGAMHQLSVKGSKKKDEVDLLRKIRTFLKNEEKN